MQRPSKVFMTQFPALTWEMDKFGSIFSMERYQCMLLIHFQAGIIARDFKSTMPVVWLKCQDEERFLTAASAQSGDLYSFFFQSWQITPHCEVDSVNLEWNRNSQWEDENLENGPLMFVKGKVYFIPSVLLWSHRKQNELLGCLCTLKLCTKGSRQVSETKCTFW